MLAAMWRQHRRITRHECFFMTELLVRKTKLQAARTSNRRQCPFEWQMR